MRRSSALHKGQTAVQSPLSLGRVSQPWPGRYGCGLCGAGVGVICSFSLFVAWILLQ